MKWGEQLRFQYTVTRTSFSDTKVITFIDSWQEADSNVVFSVEVRPENANTFPMALEIMRQGLAECELFEEGENPASVEFLGLLKLICDKAELIY